MSKRSETEARYARYQEALNHAYVAASAAQAGKVEDMNALNCGFAWVIVHDASFARWCRTNAKRCLAKAVEFAVDSPMRSVWNKTARNYGSKATYAGWQFWKPGSFDGQDVDIHLTGAKAFSDSLAQSLQIRCEVGSRLD